MADDRKVYSLEYRFQSSEVRGQQIQISLCTWFFTSCFLLLASLVSAANQQDWWKKIGKQKIRKVHSKQTVIAAVRGVDEPGKVDRSARNYEAVAEMEMKTIASDKLLKFITEGKLVLQGHDR